MASAVQVWEPESQAQVLKVAPFIPHRPPVLGQAQMDNPLSRAGMVDEMALVKNRMTAVRAYVVFDAYNQLQAAINKLSKDGQPLERLLSDAASVLAPVRSVATLLQVISPGLLAALLS